jgi:hypothetical protein
MRKSDKIKNFKKVNLLTEQRYLQTKNIITESSYYGMDESGLGISGSEIDIDGITDALVATTLHGGDDNTVYLRAKDSLADSNDQVKGEFYTMLANKMDANNLTSQAQQYRSIAQQFQGELEEGMFSNMFDRGDNSKNEAINEVDRYDFKRLFAQVGGTQYSDPKIAMGRIEEAKKQMPKVAELLPELFKLKNSGYYVNASMEFNGQRINGVIPSCFELLLAEHSTLEDNYAKVKIKEMINQGGLRPY